MRALASLIEAAALAAFLGGVAAVSVYFGA